MTQAPAGMKIRPVEAAEVRPLRRRVLRPHESLEQLAATEAPEAFVLGAFLEDELMATGAITPTDEPGAWRIRAMATEPGARGRGLGNAVLTALIDHARSRDAVRVWCNARTPALSLYTRAGFRVVSEEFELPDIGPHRRMELSLSPDG